LQSVEKTGRLLVVQESGAGQGLGDRIISLVARQTPTPLRMPPQLLAAPDVPVPFAPELEAGYRPDVARIVAGIEAMLGER
jgi:pyruvate/2-oxoglutarate/acetoin dehydrogenase E1 component